MKNRISLVATVALILFATVAYGQRPKIVQGNLDALAGLQQLNLEYDYANMEVGRKSEREYVAEKKERFNEKEAGRGDKWEKSWIMDRRERFEPKFEDMFSKNCDIRIGSFPDAKYTIIFRTLQTEPGYNIGISRRNAYVDGQAIIVETANRSNVICKIDVYNCPGRTAWGYDFDTGERIQEAYAVAGKVLAKFLRKHID